MNRKLHILFILCFVIQGILVQAQTVAGPPTQAVHNAAKYNRFLFNPAFSYDKDAADSGDKNGYISVYGRLEKVDFEDAPRNINATYSKTFNEKMSFGGGLFQQNIGVISHFGAVFNYTYNVEFTRDIFVSFGANASYQRAGLKSELRTASSIEANNLLGEFDGTSLLRLTPGVNLNYKNFDFGITARNIISASLGGNQNTFNSSTFVVHGMYSKPFARRSPNSFRGMLYVEKETALDPVVGLNAYVENNKYGFAQLGYNQVFGVSLGLGFNITRQASIAYTIERGLGTADVFGLNHEFTLAYNFVEPQRRGRRRPSAPKSKRKLPEREELSKAEKIIALREAREQNQTKLVALQEAKDKAALLRTTKLKEEEEKDKASELVRTVSLQINDNSLEKAKITLERIKNSKYISDDDKRALIARYTKKLEISQDIEAETARVAAETTAKNEARAQLTRTLKFLDDENVTDARSTLALIKDSQYISPEEKRQITSRLQRLTQQKEEAAQVAAVEEEERKKGSELLRTTQLMLAENDVEGARNRATLIRQNKFIPADEKEAILKRIQSSIQANEAVALEEENKRRGSELVRTTNLLLDQEDTVAAKQNIEQINQNKFIPQEEKTKIISRLQRILNKQEEVAEAEEEAKKLSTLKRIAAEKKLEEKQQLLSETEAIVNEGSLEEVRARATLLRTSTLLPEEEKEKILSSLKRVIIEKEADAESARIAEEQRLAAEQAAREAEAARIAEEQRLATQQAAREAEAARIAEEQRLAAEEEAREAEAARIAEEQRLAAEEAARIAEERNAQLELEKQQLISETEAIINGGSLEEVRARATLLRTSTLVPEDEKERILSSLKRVIIEKEAEKEQLVSETETIANEGSLEEMRARATLLRTSTLVPEEEKEKILSTLKRVIIEKEAETEAARIAEEQRLAAEEAAREAEAARIAEEQRLAAEQAAREVEAARIAEEQRLAAEQAAREVEAARIAEEQRLAAEQAAREEAARIAEEQRLAAEQAAREAEAARIAEQQRLAAEQAAREAEAARIAEEQRLAAEQAAREAEAARIAEEQRLAAEAEAARQAEELRFAEEARLEQERLLREAEEANKKKATITRTTSTVKEEDEDKKRAELKRINKIISDEDQKEERRKAVQAALKRTTKNVEKEETQKGATLKRTLLPQRGSENNRTNSNGMGFEPDIIEMQKKFFEKELLLKPSIKIQNADIVSVIDALVKSKTPILKVKKQQIINLDDKKRLLKTKLLKLNTSEKQ